MKREAILIAGEWTQSKGAESFQAYNPRAKAKLDPVYPVSPWEEVEQAVHVAYGAFEQLRAIPAETRALFLEACASGIERRAEELIEQAHLETALPIRPRLAEVELPRTTGQLRQAAVAAREGSWSLPTIDTKANIRSHLAPLGPVCVFGPNNFPFAFNSASGGDFAAAIAAGNPVIAKANTAHPGTTRLLAEEAHAAAIKTGMPPATVQLLYRLGHADGERLVAHPLIGASGYTGAREPGLVLKKAADLAGKPIYLELSSINPIVILPGALRERGGALAEEFQTSCLMGTGQFCTNPGLVLLLAGPETDRFVESVAARFHAAPIGTLLGPRVESSLAAGVEQLLAAGAKLITGGQRGGGTGYSYANTLLATTGRRFLDNAKSFQTEAFGNASLLVVAENLDELCAVVSLLEGNLTGALYSDSTGTDDDAYGRVEPILRERVGRLLNDKMPTGVAVSSAMNHGGPYPATGHPGFTAVGMPAAIRRFSALHCYDNVREHRLPPALRNQNGPGRPWRLVDGSWTRSDL